MTVANPFIQHKAEGKHLAPPQIALIIKILLGFLFAQRHKTRGGAKFVQMVENRVDAQTSHIGDVKAGMEGAGFVDEFRHQTHFIQITQGKHHKTFQPSGDKPDSAIHLIGDVVPFGFFRHRRDPFVIEASHNIPQGVVGRKHRQNLGFFPIVGQRTLHRHRCPNIIVGINLFPCNKTVQARAQGKHPNHRRQHHVHQPQVGQIGGSFFFYIPFQFGNVNGFFKKDLTIQTTAHNVGDNPERQIHFPYPIPIIAIAQTALALGGQRR